LGNAAAGADRVAISAVLFEFVGECRREGRDGLARHRRRVVAFVAWVREQDHCYNRVDHRVGEALRCDVHHCGALRESYQCILRVWALLHSLCEVCDCVVCSDLD